MKELARFRADPSKVRVSVRRSSDGLFMVKIAERADDKRLVVGAHLVVRSAVYRALLLAQAAGLDGVDLDLAWTYPHPQRCGEHASVRQASRVLQ